MKKLPFLLIVFVLPVFILTGCASYNASPLKALSLETIQSSDGKNKNEVLISAKTFDKADCKKYLDRNVIEKGYRPIQLYIGNYSDESYILSLEKISMNCTKAEEVAEKVHTSTAGRAGGYGAAAFFTFGILAIPAVVDGVKSSQANDSLDHDFVSKGVSDQNLILPQSHFNKLIFVPEDEYQPVFTVTLINQKSNASKVLVVSPKKSLEN